MHAARLRQRAITIKEEASPGEGGALRSPVGCLSHESSGAIKADGAKERRRGAIRTNGPRADMPR